MRRPYDYDSREPNGRIFPVSEFEYLFDVLNDILLRSFGEVKFIQKVYIYWGKLLLPYTDYNSL